MLGDTLHWVMIRDHVKSSSPISYEIHVVGKNISIEGPFLAYEFLNSHKWLSQIQTSFKIHKSELFFVLNEDQQQ